MNKMNHQSFSRSINSHRPISSLTSILYYTCTLSSIRTLFAPASSAFRPSTSSLHFGASYRSSSSSSSSSSTFSACSSRRHSYLSLINVSPSSIQSSNKNNIIMPNTRSGKSTIAIATSTTRTSRKSSRFFNSASDENENANDTKNSKKDIKIDERKEDEEVLINVTKKRRTRKTNGIINTSNAKATITKSKASAKPTKKKTPKSPTSTKYKTKKAPTTPSSTPTTKKTTKSTSSSSSSSSRKRKRIEPGSLSPPDKNWTSTYTLIQELRKDKTAPMDYDGGHALPQKEFGMKVYRYQVLTALMLSSQTKDAVVGDAMRTLQSYKFDNNNNNNDNHDDNHDKSDLRRNGLNVYSIHEMDNVILSNMIGKVGFYNNKTKYIKQTAKILIDEYDGDIPPNAQEMMKLPGVGPKMAYIIESIVYNKSSGIGVDTHMHRIFNDIKWVNKTKTPEQTREQLEGWLPKEKWGELNSLFVGFGQESTQQKEKILKKALGCSRPVDALALLRKVGMDVKKESKKYGLEDDVNLLLKGRKEKVEKVEKEDDKESKE